MQTTLSAARLSAALATPATATVADALSSSHASAAISDRAGAQPPADLPAGAHNADLIGSLPRSALDALKGPPVAGTVVLLERPKADLSLYTAAPPLEGVITQRQGEIYTDALENWMFDAARKAGLDENQVRKLDAILHDGSNDKADVELVRDLLSTENPARALRAFNDLDIYRRQHPDRITPEIFRALTLGVGQARTSSSQGNEGILSNSSAIYAAEALVRMTPGDYNAIYQALSYAGRGSAARPLEAGSDMQKEMALILKATAARVGQFGDATLRQPTSPACTDVVQFAAAIRGRNADTLMQLTTAIDLNANRVDEALQQKWSHSCVEATLQIARAEADPVYALWLHEHDTLHNTSDAGVIADEQKQQLTAAGGRPTPRDAGVVSLTGRGTSDDAWSSLSNATVSPSTARTYEQRRVDDSGESRTHAVEHMEQLVKTGTDVPIRVDWPDEGGKDGGAHALLVTDVRGKGAAREFLVTDPWSGRTGWVKGNDIVDGNTNFFGSKGTLTSYWW